MSQKDFELADNVGGGSDLTLTRDHRALLFGCAPPVVTTNVRGHIALVTADSGQAWPTSPTMRLLG